MSFGRKELCALFELGRGIGVLSDHEAKRERKTVSLIRAGTRSAGPSGSQLRLPLCFLLYPRLRISTTYPLIISSTASKLDLFSAVLHLSLRSPLAALPLFIAILGPRPFVSPLSSPLSPPPDRVSTNHLVLEAVAPPLLHARLSGLPRRSLGSGLIGLNGIGGRGRCGW
jgi:hypothetical protein